MKKVQIGNAFLCNRGEAYGNILRACLPSFFFGFCIGRTTEILQDDQEQTNYTDPSLDSIAK